MKTVSQVREMLRASAPGITFRREESGEFRVTFTQAAIAAAFPELSRAELIAKAESLAAYESDADSVLETGLAMARTGLRDFGAELADERNRLARELAERESAELSATAEALEREESAAPVNLDNARQMGALACDCDLPRSANPFPAGDAADAWDSGYSEAVAQWRAAKRAEIADSFGDAAADEF